MKKIVLIFLSLAFIMISYGVCKPDEDPYNINVLVLKYFPVTLKDGQQHIDINVTQDWEDTLENTRNKTNLITQQLVSTLEDSSIYHGYKDPSEKPSLKYTIVGELEFLQPLPTLPRLPGADVTWTNYNALLNRVNIKDWVMHKGVKEVWIWGYQGYKNVGIYESNMSGPYGNISNGSRRLGDMPLLDKTYTVYTYNYQRGLSEALEDHMHQIENVLKEVDRSLFWDKFVGDYASDPVLHPVRRCGWAHYPPNGRKDYDWADMLNVQTDIENWQPDGGRLQTMNCTHWGCSEGEGAQWFHYWMQNLPGRNNGIMYHGKALTNWWVYIGDFDNAMANKVGLVEH